LKKSQICKFGLQNAKVAKLQANVLVLSQCLTIVLGQWCIWGMVGMDHVMGATLPGAQKLLVKILICDLKFLEPLFCGPKKSLVCSSTDTVCGASELYK